MFIVGVFVGVATPVIAIAMSIIMAFEGFSETPYKCPGGYSTIGYGHVLEEGEQNIVTMTEEEARDYLEADCKVCLQAINRSIKAPLNDNQKAALISLCYNIGTTALVDSTLRKKINAGLDASSEFLRWDRVRGKRLKGLTKRRRVERQIFLTKNNIKENFND